MKGCGFTDHYFTDNHNLKQNRKEHSFRFSGHLLRFVTDNGVFSKTGIDEGTQILLNVLQHEEIKGRVLDLGCGYGVIALTLKKLFPDADLTAADINPRAVELTKLNAEKNETECSALVSDGFAEITDSFDVVVSNPPIRTGKQNIYRMFREAYAHMNRDGVFYAVIRRKQGAESACRELERIFGNCTVIDRSKGYWILKSLKLTD